MPFELEQRALYNTYICTVHISSILYINIGYTNNWVDPVERYGKCTVVGVAHLLTNNNNNI